MPITDFLKLDGKIAVVTGAARGIGRAIAELLALAGASVVVADILEVETKETVQHIAASGGTAAFGNVDISSEPSVKQMYDIANGLGGLDIVINAAAIFPKYSMLDITTEQWDRIHAINTRGAFLVMREAIRRMKVLGNGGAFVHVSSISGERALVCHNIAYGSSKAAVTNMTRVAAMEFGADGIRVNAVLPGGTATEGVREVNADMAARGLSLTGPITGLNRIPLGQMGTPQDIANACLFLASPAAKYITGQALIVDGGFMVG